MNKRDYYKRTVVFALAVVYMLVIMAAFSIVWDNYYNLQLSPKFYRNGSILLVAIYGVIYLVFAKIFDGLRVGYMKKLDVIYSLILTSVCSNVICYMQIALIHRGFLNPLYLAQVELFDILFSLLWIFASSWIYMELYPPRKMLLIYGERKPDSFEQKVLYRRDKYQICERVHISVGEEEIHRMMKKYDAVIIWDLPAAIRNRLLKYCFAHSIRSYVTPKISDILVKGSNRIHLFDTPLLLSRNIGLTADQLVAKRIMDILISLVGIILSSPFMLISAILIKAYDRGPILYKQERLTIGGRPFMIYKFRSMRIDSEKNGAQLATKNDDRITPVGKVLRNLHFDELPQLFNILKGDMSVVGPRPERRAIMHQYEKEIPEFYYRLKVKAGLTGYAQVYGKYNTVPYDKLKLDLFYIQNYSFWLDIKLMLMTFRIVFQKETSEGISDDKKTALPDQEQKK